MTLTRNVNGQTVVLSDEEEAAVRAEWAANPLPVAGPPQPTLQDVIDALPLDVQQKIAAAVYGRKTV
jgi:hypothetical protein